MIFQPDALNFHYRQLCLCSEEKRWQIGLSLYASGLRLRMGHRNRPPAVLDFCLGGEANIFWPVFDAVIQRLSEAGESWSGREINELFPWKQGRPNLAVHLGGLLSTRLERSA